MNRVRVTSSNIVSIGYDDSKLILEVEFKSGEVYQYLNVPKNHHTGIMNVESHGKYLNAHIKPKFKFREVH